LTTDSGRGGLRLFVRVNDNNAQRKRAIISDRKGEEFEFETHEEDLFAPDL
jgi:hypothetical protein